MSSGPRRHRPAGTSADARRPGLLGVRDAARGLVAAAPVPAGWGVRGLRRLGPAAVLVEVGPAEGPGVLLEWRERIPGEPDAPCFLAGPRHRVGWRNGPGAWDLDDAATPEAVKRAAAEACRALAEPGDAVTLVDEAAPGAATAAPTPFAPDAFATWLAPVLAAGDELLPGWRLDDVHGFGPAHLALVFRRDADGARESVKVRRRDDARGAAHRTRHLDLVTSPPAGADAAERAADLAALAAELALHLDAADRGAGFLEAAPPAAGAAPAGPPPALNMALPAPCHQACVFCSIQDEVAPVEDAPPEYVARLREDIRAAAARGTRTLRLNGLEPLNAPFALELLALAREVGFDTAHILSTCLPLADRAYAERLVAVLPPTRRFYVPLYGSTAAVHDAVTGRPGSFDALMAAVGHLADLLGPEGQIVFTTVLVRGNAHDTAGMAALADPLAEWWEVHLAFPNSSSRRDRYRDVALQYSRALDAMYPAGAPARGDLALGEVPVCVAWRHQRGTGHRLVTAERLRRRQPLSGTYYETAGYAHSLGGGAFTSATVPCPHVARCAAAPCCPGRAYAAYAEEFGLDELAPLSWAALEELPDGPDVVRLVRSCAAAA